MSSGPAWTTEQVPEQLGLLDKETESCGDRETIAAHGSILWTISLRTQAFWRSHVEKYQGPSVSMSSCYLANNQFQPTTFHASKSILNVAVLVSPEKTTVPASMCQNSNRTYWPTQNLWKILDAYDLSNWVLSCLSSRQKTKHQVKQIKFRVTLSLSRGKTFKYCRLVTAMLQFIFPVTGPADCRWCYQYV